MLGEMTASWPSASLRWQEGSLTQASFTTECHGKCRPLRIHSAKRPLGLCQYWPGILFGFQSLYPQHRCPLPALLALAVNVYAIHSIFFSSYSLLNEKRQFLCIELNMNRSPKILATRSWKCKRLPAFKCRVLSVHVCPCTFIRLCIYPKRSLAVFPNKQL